MPQKTQLQFSIVTTERIVYEQIIRSVTLPTSAGEITIFPNHIPLVSTLRTGSITVHTENGKQTFAVAGGIIEMRKNNHVVVLASNSEAADQIDIDRAQAAYDRAREYLEEKKGVSDSEYARLQAILEKNLNRVAIAKRYRSR